MSKQKKIGTCLGPLLSKKKVKLKAKTNFKIWKQRLLRVIKLQRLTQKLARFWITSFSIQYLSWQIWISDQPTNLR